MVVSVEDLRQAHCASFILNSLHLFRTGHAIGAVVERPASLRKLSEIQIFIWLRSTTLLLLLFLNHVIYKLFASFILISFVFLFRYLLCFRVL